MERLLSLVPCSNAYGIPAAGLPPGTTIWPVYPSPRSSVIVVKKGASPLACSRISSASATWLDFREMNSGWLIRSATKSRGWATCSAGNSTRKLPERRSE